MKRRWSLIVFIIALVFAASQQQVSLPNQEIVLRFSNDGVSTAYIEHTIAIVKEQLQRIGVSNIQVNEKEEGLLKITYYSDTDVNGIKDVLSGDKELEPSCYHSKKEKAPSENNLDYKLDVFELQKQDSGLGLGGKFAVELKSEKNQFLNPFIPAAKTYIETLGNNFTKQYNFKTYLEPTKKGSSLKIPDGRAGPIS